MYVWIRQHEKTYLPKLENPPRVYILCLMEFNCSILSHLIQFLYGNPHFYSSCYFIPPKKVYQQNLMLASQKYDLCATGIRKPLESW